MYAVLSYRYKKLLQTRVRKDMSKGKGSSTVFTKQKRQVFNYKLHSSPWEMRLPTNQRKGLSVRRTPCLTGIESNHRKSRHKPEIESVSGFRCGPHSQRNSKTEWRAGRRTSATSETTEHPVFCLVNPLPFQDYIAAVQLYVNMLTNHDDR